MKMKNILCYAPDNLDGISFYRMHGPLGELEKKDLIKVRTWGNVIENFGDWTYFTKSEIALMQRPGFSDQDWKFVEVAKKYGVKIWVDFDDDLLHLPNDSIVFQRFCNPRSVEIQKFVIENADIVSFATPYLEKLYRDHYGIKETIVIPNAIPPQFLKYKKPFKYEKKIAWRGSPSHLPEMIYHAADIISMMNLYPDWEWRFYGINPHFIYRYVKGANLKYCESLPLIDFVDAFTEFNAPIQFVLLLESHFHRSKSNLGWMDGSLAGSVVLGPNFEEWKRPGLHNYRIQESQSFKNNLDDLIRAGPGPLERDHKLSWEWISDNILLDKINEMRINLINNL